MTDPTELIDQLINKPQALTMSTRRQCASVIARLSTDIEALCGLVIECRSSVRLDLENYERVIDDMDRSDQQRAAAWDAAWAAARAAARDAAWAAARDAARAAAWDAARAAQKQKFAEVFCGDVLNIEALKTKAALLETK